MDASYGEAIGTDLRRLARRASLVALVGVAALLAFLGFAQIEGAVIAPGQVKVDLNRKAIQHREGGIVAAVHVRDGQRVAAGELLVELGDVSVDASIGLLRGQFDAERVRQARLTAERAMQRVIVLPPDLAVRRGEVTVADLLRREQALFESRRQSLDGQTRLLEEQIVQVRSESAAVQEQLKSEREALELQKEELALNEKLLQENFIQRTRLITLQRAVAEYAARIGEHEAQFAQSRQRASELALRIAGLRNAYSETASRELTETTTRLQEIEQRLRPSEDASSRQRLVSPVAGEVVGLRYTAAGMVVGPRETILEIVAEDAKLIVEGRIRTQDIAHVALGASADVRLTAFNLRANSVLDGKVQQVSADAMQDRPGDPPYYMVQVEVDPASLAKDGHVWLKAGMPAELFVKTRARSILSYLAEPVILPLRRAMRDS